MKLLLAVDDSVHSEKAVEALCHIEWIKGSELSILNVVKPMEYLLPFGGSDDTEGKEAELTKARGAWLEQLSAKISAKLPALKVTHKVKFGDTRFVIINTAVSEGVDLIVMGSQGRTGVERLILGSVSCSVVEYAPCPVLIIKGEPSTWGDFHKVFVAFDGSAYSHDAIDWICDRTWGPETKIHVVMTLPEFDTADAQNVSQVESGVLKAQWTIINTKAMEMLQEAADEIGRTVGRENVTIESLPGDPRSELLKAATKFGAELIIMGSRGRTGLTKFLLGSVSLHLANHADVPIAIVRRLAPETLASLYAPDAKK
jgi:nucleotide-binding universal stress UspA family protein